MVKGVQAKVFRTPAGTKVTPGCSQGGGQACHQQKWPWHHPTTPCSMGLSCPAPATACILVCISCLHPSKCHCSHTTAPSPDWRWTTCALQQDSATLCLYSWPVIRRQQGASTSRQTCREAQEVQDRPGGVCVLGHRQGSKGTLAQCYKGSFATTACLRIAFGARLFFLSRQLPADATCLLGVS